MPARDGGVYPDDARQADARGGDDRGYQRVAKPAQAAAEYLDRGVRPVPRCHESEYLHRDDHDRLVLNEQAEEEAAGHHEQHGDERSRDHAERHAVAQAGACSVIQPRTIVLADKGHQRDAVRVQNHPVERVELVHGDPRGDGVRAELVDGRGDYHVGDGVEHGLKPCGKADVHRAAHHASLDAYVFQLEPVALLAAYQAAADEHGAD